MTVSVYDYASKLELALIDKDYKPSTFTFDFSGANTKQENMNRVVAGVLGAHVLNSTAPVNTTYFIKMSGQYALLNFNFLPVRRAKAFFGDYSYIKPGGLVTGPNMFSSAVPTSVDDFVRRMNNASNWRIGSNHYHRTLTPMFSILEQLAAN